MGSGLTQLVERSLPIPEVRGSNPVIDNIYIEHLFTSMYRWSQSHKQTSESSNYSTLGKTKHHDLMLQVM